MLLPINVTELNYSRMFEFEAESTRDGNITRGEWKREEDGNEIAPLDDW